MASSSIKAVFLVKKEATYEGPSKLGQERMTYDQNIW